MPKRIAVLASISKSQYFINQAYTDYLEDAGLFPVLITPNMSPDTALSICEGLLMPGGIDIDPIYYGVDNRTSYAVDPKKDEFEREMFHAFREAGLPVFGICRGFQMIALEYLSAFPSEYEFLDYWPDIPQHNQTGSLQLSRTIHSHFVTYSPHHLYGEKRRKADTMAVNSMHHQCLVADYGTEGIIGTDRFRMTAWTTRGLKRDEKAVEKGEAFPVVCEGLRIFDWGGPILAVQWHPEEIRDLDLIANFFEEKGKPNPKVTRAVVEV